MAQTISRPSRQHTGTDIYLPVQANADGRLSVNANTGYKRQETLTEALNSRINELEIRLANAKRNKELVTTYEKQFKAGDVVFTKETGPAIFNRLVILNEAEYLPEPIPENVSFGDIVAVIQTLRGQEVTKIDSLVPYTENVKLLYESERSNSND